MTPADSILYVQQHQTGQPDRLVSIMATDFGQGSGNVSNADEIIWRAEEIDRRLALAQALREKGDIHTHTQAGADWFDHEMGPGRDLLAQIVDLAGKADGGPVTPPSPPVYLAYYGTYTGHGWAQDAYAGRNEQERAWGPHHDIPLVAPVRGHVERYEFGTPLSTQALHKVAKAEGKRYAENLQALFTGWTCAIPEQTMFVAVFWPDEPLIVQGRRLGHLHYGHVHQDILTGVVGPGQQFAKSWDSGIRFEPGNPTARAAHVHCCAGAGTTLSPNGDVDGVYAIIAQGWDAQDIQRMPGPTDYQVPNRYCAGRLLTDFQQSGHAVPPMPS